MKRSAGILLYRRGPGRALEVLLVHMGGPFWSQRDAGAWSIPKGELVGGEDALQVARREFEEELGSPLPPAQLVSLGEVTQSGGKHVAAFAGEADFDAETIHSNTFTIEWPRGSGRQQEFPEVDRAAWVGVADARTKLVQGQVAFVDRLLAHLAAPGGPSRDERETPGAIVP